MSRWTREGKFLCVMAAMALILMTGASAEAQREGEVEVLLEGGVSFPYGDLGDEYFGTERGGGAETGYEIGARVRYFFSPEMALAPAFHFADFGNFVGVAEGLGAFEIATSVIRYGMDLQYFLPAGYHRSRYGVRPFLNAGAGLYRNRYRDELQEDGATFSFYETAINTFGVALGGGLRVGDFEWSVIYHINRFETVRLSDTGLKEDYNWDYLVIRAGFAFPTR